MPEKTNSIVTVSSGEVQGRVESWEDQKHISRGQYFEKPTTKNIREKNLPPLVNSMKEQKTERTQLTLLNSRHSLLTKGEFKNGVSSLGSGVVVIAKTQ